MTTMIKKVVIPVAGMGTRLLPATKVLPKEMLPVAGRPAIQFAVEEAAASGLELVILVTRPGTSLAVQHLQHDVALENSLVCGGRVEEAEALRHLSELVEIRTVVQEAPLGLAHAIREASTLVGTEPFAVLLPDALIDSEIPALRQLIHCHNKHRGCIIATQKVSPDQVERFGMIDPAPMQDSMGGTRTFRVTSLVERPRRGLATSEYGIFGRYILEPEIFQCIDKIQPGLGGELQLTDALQLYSQTMPIYAYEFEGVHYDIGNKLGLLQANLAYSLKDPLLASSLLEFLTKLESLHPEAVR